MWSLLHFIYAQIMLLLKSFNVVILIAFIITLFIYYLIVVYKKGKS